MHRADGQSDEKYWRSVTALGLNKCKRGKEVSGSVREGSSR